MKDFDKSFKKFFGGESSDVEFDKRYRTNRGLTKRQRKHRKGFSMREQLPFNKVALEMMNAGKDPKSIDFRTEQQFKDEFSRFRNSDGRDERETTPKGYWDLTFLDEQPGEKVVRSDDPPMEKVVRRIEHEMYHVKDKKHKKKKKKLMKGGWIKRKKELPSYKSSKDHERINVVTYTKEEYEDRYNVHDFK
jgi:hypothetical protein